MNMDFHMEQQQQDGVDGHSHQFGDSDWLSMVEYSNYNILGQQQPEASGVSNAIEAVQWNYIQSLEQKVAYLEQELNLARAQLAHRPTKTSTGSTPPTAHSRSPEPVQSVEGSPRVASEEDETAESSNGSTKRRKYVRKPRPDANAPVKPLTAYASFANDMRKRYQERDLSFSDLAKLIGHDWQKCPADLRDLYLSNAQSEKEMYEEELRGYKSTESYQKYQEYVQDFKHQAQQKKMKKLGSASS